MRHIGISVRRLTGSTTKDALAFVDVLRHLPFTISEFDWRQYAAADDVSVREHTRQFDGILHPYVGSTRRLWSRAFQNYIAVVHSAHRRVMPAMAVYRTGCRKEYLLALQERGVPTVPTVLCTAPTRVSQLMEVGVAALGTQALVVKPADGELSADVRLVADLDDESLRAIVGREPTLLLQPYVAAIKDGQLSLCVVVTDGEPVVSHAVVKVPHQWHALTAASSVHEQSVEGWMDRYARMTLEAWPTLIRHGLMRIDVVRNTDPLVIEVETVNPVLSLSYVGPHTLRRFEDLIETMLSRWLG